jgi:hypothetical protein
VSLQHLQSLFLGLELKGGEDPLLNVSLKYREALPEALEQELQSVIGAIDMTVLLPTLREFAVEQLCTDAWPAEASLKEYLCYGSEEDLNSFKWFIDIPDMLQLRHTYITYQMLSKR